MLFVHLIILLLVGSILYWMAGKLAVLAPAPVQAKVLAALYVLLGCLAIMFLLGEVGLWGTWGWGYHGGHVR